MAVPEEIRTFQKESEHSQKKTGHFKRNQSTPRRNQDILKGIRALTKRINNFESEVMIK